MENDMDSISWKLIFKNSQYPVNTVRASTDYKVPNEFIITNKTST